MRTGRRCWPSPPAGALLVTLTLPDRLEAGHVEFARQLACRAMAYAVEVERRYRGLAPLPDREQVTA